MTTTPDEKTREVSSGVVFFFVIGLCFAMVGGVLGLWAAIRHDDPGYLIAVVLAGATLVATGLFIHYADD